MTSLPGDKPGQLWGRPQPKHDCNKPLRQSRCNVNVHKCINHENKNRFQVGGGVLRGFNSLQVFQGTLSLDTWLLDEVIDDDIIVC